MLKKLIETRKADAGLPTDIRAALIDSLFAPLASLLVGTVACSIIGGVAALRVSNAWILVNSIAILAVGMLRVVSVLVYRKYTKSERAAATQLWERVFKCGAWGFSMLLGLLCWFSITQTTDTSVQMAVTATATGYAAAVSSRNAARPFIAVGQLTLCALPMAVALLICPDWVHQSLGFVMLLFVYGMINITLNIRDVIIQALIMTRKESALAARFQEQANRFDIALNNMSHGLCMLDAFNRVQVWNERFLELVHLQNVPVRVGMRISQLARHCIRARNHRAKGFKQFISDVVRGLAEDKFGRFEISLDGNNTIAVSRRMMADGGSVVILEDVTERKRAQERITHLAKCDELTGLANRPQFRERINAMLATIHERQSRLAIHLIDLDRFKAINDTLGHPMGDKLLKEVAFRLNAEIKAGDMIARIGGDEFVMLQTVTEFRQDAEWLAKRIARTLKERFEIDGHRIDISASIGIAIAPADGANADELLKKADMALYAAKNDGGGHRFFATDMEQTVKERRALELDLREALALQQFTLNYQPLVDLHTGRITTCEALMRWTHPVRGEVPPSIFIPVAEETGLIVALGEWGLQRACAEAASWPDKVKVAVNLSPREARNRGLVLRVALALADSGLSPQRLELEMTERLLLHDNDWTLATMQQLKNLGVGLSLDDFGTGYSSLNYLCKFPFHKIKIDQSFISGIGDEAGGDERDVKAIIGAVVRLGVGLDKIVVTEGIETEEQMKLVTAHGCHEGQGYLFGRPMTGEAIRARLETQAAESQLVA